MLTPPLTLGYGRGIRTLILAVGVSTYAGVDLDRDGVVVIVKTIYKSFNRRHRIDWGTGNNIRADLAAPQVGLHEARHQGYAIPQNTRELGAYLLDNISLEWFQSSDADPKGGIIYLVLHSLPITEEPHLVLGLRALYGVSYLSTKLSDTISVEQIHMLGCLIQRLITQGGSQHRLHITHVILIHVSQSLVVAGKLLP